MHLFASVGIYIGVAFTGGWYTTKHYSPFRTSQLDSLISETFESVANTVNNVGTLTAEVGDLGQ